MNYMGSKRKHMDQILPLLMKNMYKDTCYVEPFVGGANVVERIPKTYRRICGEYNEYVAKMWIELERGWVPPEMYTREQYYHIRDNKDQYDCHVVGYVGICCSYMGKWFGGYSGDVCYEKKTRNFITEFRNQLIGQIPKIKGVEFNHCSYENLVFDDKSVVYCDPPYRDTTGYKDEFDHGSFWEWVRVKSKKNFVYVSEYTAPSDFTSVLDIETSCNLSTSGKIKKTVERVFVHNSILDSCKPPSLDFLGI